MRKLFRRCLRAKYITVDEGVQNNYEETNIPKEDIGE